MPTSPNNNSGRQLSLEVSVSRQADRFAKYFLTVTNHSGATVEFDARYAVLGWSRASRDEEMGDQDESEDQLMDGGGAGEELAPGPDAPDASDGADQHGGHTGREGSDNGHHGPHGELVDAGAAPGR